MTNPEAIAAGTPIPDPLPDTPVLLNRSIDRVGAAPAVTLTLSLMALSLLMWPLAGSLPVLAAVLLPCSPSCSPQACKRRTTLGPSCTPAPTSENTAARSNTRTSHPACEAPKAAAMPAMPPPGGYTPPPHSQLLQGGNVAVAGRQADLDGFEAVGAQSLQAAAAQRARCLCCAI